MVMDYALSEYDVYFQLTSAIFSNLAVDTKK